MYLWRLSISMVFMALIARVDALYDLDDLSLITS